MANGAPSRSPGALSKRDRGKTPAGDGEGFNADARSATRQETPVTIGGRTFRRHKKTWTVSLALRRLLREQESAIAKTSRLSRRIAELETEQSEAAAEGAEDREEELEVKIRALLNDSDEATERAELVTYRLVVLLLNPDDPGDQDALEGFGPDNADDERWLPAVEFLQPELDVEDAAELARELTGSREPDPPTTPSSGTGSS